MAKQLDILFLTGAPRSGTTTLLDFLTVNRGVGWIPEVLAAQPQRLSLASHVRRQHWPLLGDFWLERRYAWKRVTSPAEGQQFWSHWIPGFELDYASPHIPEPEDLTEEQVATARKAVESVCRKQGVSQFVGHYTGMDRVKLLKRIFPQARFIQMMRDPRSVAYHLVRRIEGGDHPLWDNRQAWIELFPPALQERLASLEDTPLNFSGVMVRWYHMRFKEAFSGLAEEEWSEVAYSDLMAYPEPTLKRVYQYAGFAFNNRFQYYLKYHQIHNSNHRTNRNLNDEEKEQLAQAIAPVDDIADS